LYLKSPQLIERYNFLDGNRYNFKNIWQQIANYMVPFKNNITQLQTPGSAKMNQVYDSTAMTSLEYLAGALHGMLTSPTSYFFGLTSGDPMFDQQDSVAAWIQDTVRRMHLALNNSNFQTEVHEYYIDLCGFGNASLFIEEDVKDVFRFSSWPLQDLVIDENHHGLIDCVYHKYKLDARGIMDEFGKQKGAIIPDVVLAAYRDGKTEEFEIQHSIYPRASFDTANQQKFDYISHYTFIKTKEDLLLKGFREFPLVYGRWKKVSGEMYGRGPGETALPDAKTLNEMTKITLRAAQKVIDPPLMSPDDGFVMPLITRPGGINYYRAGTTDKIEPLFNNAQVDFGFQAVERKQASIREAFYVDQLQLKQGPQMTATEVSARIEQSLRFLAPMLGRQQSEFLSPLISRVYAIMQRRGMIKPAPAILANKKLHIVYSSVMAMAQKMSEMQNIQKTLQSVAPLTSMDPGVLDNFNVDRSARYIAKLNNFPQEMLNTEAERAQLRQAKAEAQANAEKSDKIAQNAKAVSDVMKVAQPQGA
jgi:hypothetical protein